MARDFKNKEKKSQRAQRRLDDATFEAAAAQSAGTQRSVSKSNLDNRDVKPVLRQVSPFAVLAEGPVWVFALRRGPMFNGGGGIGMLLDAAGEDRHRGLEDDHQEKGAAESSHTKRMEHPEIAPLSSFRDDGARRFRSAKRTGDDDADASGTELVDCSASEPCALGVGCCVTFILVRLTCQ